MRSLRPASAALPRAACRSKCRPSCLSTSACAPHARPAGAWCTARTRRSRPRRGQACGLPCCRSCRAGRAAPGSGPSTGVGRRPACAPPAARPADRRRPEPAAARRAAAAATARTARSPTPVGGCSPARLHRGSRARPAPGAPTPGTRAPAGWPACAQWPPSVPRSARSPAPPRPAGRATCRSCSAPRSGPSNGCRGSRAKWPCRIG